MRRQVRRCFVQYSAIDECKEICARFAKDLKAPIQKQLALDLEEHLTSYDYASPVRSSQPASSPLQMKASFLRCATAKLDSSFKKDSDDTISVQSFTSSVYSSQLQKKYLLSAKERPISRSRQNSV